MESFTENIIYDKPFLSSKIIVHVPSIPLLIKIIMPAMKHFCHQKLLEIVHAPSIHTIHQQYHTNNDADMDSIVMLQTKQRKGRWMQFCFYEQQQQEGYRYGYDTDSIVLLIRRRRKNRGFVVSNKIHSSNFRNWNLFLKIKQQNKQLSTGSLPLP